MQPHACACFGSSYLRDWRAGWVDLRWSAGMWSYCCWTSNSTIGEQNWRTFDRHVITWARQFHVLLRGSKLCWPVRADQQLLHFSGDSRHRTGWGMQGETVVPPRSACTLRWPRRADRIRRLWAVLQCRGVQACCSPVVQAEREIILYGWVCEKCGLIRRPCPDRRIAPRMVPRLGVVV